MRFLPRSIALVLIIAAAAPAVATTGFGHAPDTRNTTVGATAAPTINVYCSSSPLGSALSVTVSASDGSQSQAVPVELLRSSNTTLNFARLAFTGTIKVTVGVPNATNYSMSPRRCAIATQVNTSAQTPTFTLSNDGASPCYLSYGQSIRLIVHDYYGSGPKLFLFFDRQMDMPVRDGVTVFDATQDFGITPGASNCSLEDVTLTGTGAWSVYIHDSSDIIGANYKIINELTANSDGTDPDHSRRVTLSGVFAHTNVDAFAVKTTPGCPAASDSVTVTNAVIWTQKSGLKVGSEVTQAIRHIRFADNQIVVTDRGMSVYGNGNGVAGGSVDGVVFANNTIEKIQNLTQGKLVEFQVQYFANAAPYASVRNLNVSDTFCYSTSPNVSTVSGVSGMAMTNVAFERFRIDDANQAVSSVQGKVSRCFAVGSNALNVTFTR